MLTAVKIIFRVVQAHAICTNTEMHEGGAILFLQTYLPGDELRSPIIPTFPTPIVYPAKGKTSSTSIKEPQTSRLVFRTHRTIGLRSDLFGGIYITRQPQFSEHAYSSSMWKEFHLTSCGGIMVFPFEAPTYYRGGGQHHFIASPTKALPREH